MRYLLIHRHNYGISHAVIECKGFDPLKLTKESDQIALASLAGLDFEPVKNEELDVTGFDSEVTVITRSDLNKKKKE